MSLGENKSTIAAICTPLGSGAIGIVRISGNKALEIIQTMSRMQDFPPRYAKLCALYDREGELLDEVIVLYFKAPHSYTCEDVCEIQCHGGGIMVQRILQEVLHLGAVLAKNGEFTKRAYLNGRLDLSQAQAVAQIIDAKSIQAQKALVRQLKGELSEFVENCRESLYEALAYSEVMIDYAEEDIPQDTLERLFVKIDSLCEKLEKIYTHSLARSHIFEGLALSIVGKPNTGKSSLLNALLLYERAIVSDVAGTTRDTIEESLSIGGVQVRLIDTAGIRETQDKIESVGIARSKEAIEKSDVILALFDGSCDLGVEDEEICKLLESYPDKQKILIFNKSDLGLKSQKEIEGIQARFANAQSFFLSAKNQEIDGLLSYLASMIASMDCMEITLCSANQIQSVKSTLQSLQSARVELESGVLELFSYNVKDAISFLGEITKPYENADLLDKMFGEFCLGK